ncbi:hypothetical protein T552_01905 [Pneumocystis carinii B80]|uniref:Uncharacterized protein n=1 Tax=Pneumocystis carinii (strain B80) TaxID=1408658 RepID=A0A0W4ZI46_PNEC8|nr:hypothetical protein T552_01905 [Pneumocystis carinii B80]KTW28043.1 hypothetical protein T552_01905 [Pneumocystis carinii B80]
MKNKEDILRNSIIKSEIELSLNKTRKLVASWVSGSEGELSYKGENEEENERKEASFRHFFGIKMTKIGKDWEKTALKKKLLLFKNKVEEDREKKEEINEDSDELERKTLTHDNSPYIKDLNFEIYHELTPEIAPILRGYVKYNFEKETAIYNYNETLFSFAATWNYIDKGFYRVGVFNSKKKLKNGFIPWNHLRKLLEQDKDLHEEIIIYLDNSNDIWHVDYTLNILEKKKNQIPEITTSSRIVFPLSENGVMPVFNKPIALDPDGKPIENKEKTFFQKYWMYIVPFILFLLLKNRNVE